MVKPVKGGEMYIDQSTLSQAHLFIKLAIQELTTQHTSLLNEEVLDLLRMAEKLHSDDIKAKKLAVQSDT